MGGDLTKIRIEKDKITHLGDNTVTYDGTDHYFGSGIKDECNRILKHISDTPIVIGVYDNIIHTITNPNLLNNVYTSTDVMPGTFGYRLIEVQQL
jgi:hypothetical protein